MKKSLFFILFATLTVAIVSILSCQKAENVSLKEKSLNLKAPSGKEIGASTDDLKQEASKVISNKFGGEQQFEMTGIEYIPVKTGFAAIISYKLKDGTIGNYATFSGIQFKIAAQSILTNAETGKKLSSSQTLKEGTIKITCSRSGTCECKVEGTVDLNTGIVTWKCSCEQCTAEVTMG